MGDGRPPLTSAEIERLAAALTRKAMLLRTGYPPGGGPLIHEMILAVVADTVLVCEGVIRLEDLEER